MENIFIILLGLSMICIASARRLVSHINIIAIQGWFLLFACIAEFANEPWFNKAVFWDKGVFTSNLPNLLWFLFIIFEIFVIKVLIVPELLRKIAGKTGVNRNTCADIPHFYCLIISIAILLGGFLIANISSPDFKLINPLYFGTSISMIITSLWLITIKHKILSSLIGFIAMENSILLLALSVVQTMPALTALAVLPDIFTAVFITDRFAEELKGGFNNLKVSHSSDLKDYDYND